MKIEHKGPILEATHRQKGVPSWRTYGDGTKHLRITSHKDNPWLDITVSETLHASELYEIKSDYTKEASITLDADTARQLVVELIQHFGLEDMA